MNPGQYLNTGDKVVTLEAIDPHPGGLPDSAATTRAAFRGQTLHVITDAFPGEAFEGKVTAIDPLIDSATRNFQVEAAVNNSSRRLLPGMFPGCRAVG